MTLRVEDASSPPCNFGTAQQVVQVNAQPVAVAGEDQRLAVGDTVTLDGQRSYDVDGKIASWQWDLGDGTSATTPGVDHVYAAPGTYTATLTVQDDAGVANSRSSDVAKIVVNAPPVAEAGPDRHVAIGEVISFDAGASHDPDGALTSYAWDFGDGARGDGQRVQYAYHRSGVYRVGLTVRDDSATRTNTASDSLVVVVNEPPVAEAGPDQIVSSSEVHFDGSGSRDPDGTVAAYAWDFGDGGSGSGPTPVHVYKTPGSYRVQLTVTDDSGTLRSTASDAMEVVVNAAPIADAGPDLVGAPGQELKFVAAGSLDPDGDVAQYLWSFKDGADASGSQVSHKFDKPGTYNVRLSVKDDTDQDKAVDYDEAKVVINAAPVARAGPDLRAAPGDPLTFDAGSSFDPDGGALTYRWDFSDQADRASAASWSRAYKAPGVYNAQLTVTDDSGAINAVDRRRGRDPDQPPAGRLGRVRHHDLADHDHVRRLRLGRCRRRRADLSLGLRRRHARRRRRRGRPYLCRGRQLSGDAHRRRRHRSLERGRERRDHGRDQPAAGRGRRRQQRGLRPRRGRVRRQRVQGSGRRPAPLSLGLRRRRLGRHRQPDPDLRQGCRLPGESHKEFVESFCVERCF